MVASPDQKFTVFLHLKISKEFHKILFIFIILLRHIGSVVLYF